MLGKNIITLRKARGLTQAKFAEDIHVTQSAVSQWETGRTSPDVQQLFIIANYFGITVEELTDGQYKSTGAAEQGRITPAAPTPDPEAAKLAASLEKLSDENLVKLRDYMKLLLLQQEAEERKKG